MNDRRVVQNETESQKAKVVDNVEEERDCTIRSETYESIDETKNDDDVEIEQEIEITNSISLPERSGECARNP